MLQCDRNKAELLQAVEDADDPTNPQLQILFSKHKWDWFLQKKLAAVAIGNPIMLTSEQRAHGQGGGVNVKKCER